LRLQRAEWATALLITLFAVALHALRLVHAGPLWRDEAAAFHLATSPTLGELIARHESFPPPFFLIVRAWAAVLGGSDHALRLFGLLVGLGLLALFWWTVRRTAGTVPLLTLALVAVNPSVLLFGDSLRGYGLGTVAILAAFGAFARLVARPDRRALAGAAVAALLSVQLLFFNAALLLALGLAAIGVALLRRRPRVVLAVLAIGAAAALSLLPWIGPVLATRSWSVLLEVPVGPRKIFGEMAQAASAPVRALRWVWWLLGALALVPFPSEGVSKALATSASPPWPPSPIARPPTGRGGKLSCREGGGAPLPGGGRAMGEGTGVRSPGGDHRASFRDVPSEEDSGEEARDVRLFALLSLPAVVLAQWAFLAALEYEPRAWYFLPVLAVAAAALDVRLAASPLLRTVRLGAAVLAVLALALPVLSLARVRMTNVDLVAARIAAEAAPGDLVVLAPWYYGISYLRYARGSTPWMTVPDLSDHRIHRYDLVKARMARPEPLGDVLGAIERTLRSGHRVWVAGELQPLPPGEPAPVLPPAPAPGSGWREHPYLWAWSQQVGAFLRDHAVQGAQVPVPWDGPVNGFERLNLLVFGGWRQPEG
jgi:hypothetical protein